MVSFWKVSMLGAALALHQCQTPQMPVSEACGVLGKTLYRDGKFKFTDSEITAMSEINQTKIASVKIYWKANCLHQ